MKTSLFEIRIDDRLSLVIPQLNSAREIFDLIDKDRLHLRTWLPWVDFTLTVEDTSKNLSDRIEGFNKKKQASFYGTVDGNFAASVGFISLNSGEGEIGYWLLSNYEGRGLMTSFVKACVEYGFQELGLKRIIIKCAEGNIKSAAIPKRLGFTQSEKTEPTQTRNGSNHPTLNFTLERNN